MTTTRDKKYTWMWKGLLEYLNHTCLSITQNRLFKAFQIRGFYLRKKRDTFFTACKYYNKKNGTKTLGEKKIGQCDNDCVFFRTNFQPKHYYFIWASDKFTFYIEANAIENERLKIYEIRKQFSGWTQWNFRKTDYCCCCCCCYFWCNSNYEFRRKNVEAFFLNLFIWKRFNLKWRWCTRSSKETKRHFLLLKYWAYFRNVRHENEILYKQYTLNR